MTRPQKGLALITGASSGIGRDLAVLSARDGFTPVLVARSHDALHDLAGILRKEFNVSPAVVAVDLSDRDAPQRIFSAVASMHQTVDVLINNAGFGLLAPFSRSSWATYSSLLEVSVLGLTHLTHLFLPGMLERTHGWIMNVSSSAAFQPVPNLAVYSAAKEYIRHFTESLQGELVGSGVVVSLLCPGSTDTGFHAVAGTQNSLVTRWTMMRSDVVARTAWRGMMEGKRVIVPGLFNSLAGIAVRLVPRSLSGMIAARSLRDRIR